MRVVVADDDRDIRELMGFALSRAGHQVSQATNGREALQAVSEDQPDAVLLDVTMPHMSGLEVCRVLRESPQHQRLPIVILTAHADSAAAEQARTAGATAYMAKPFALADLVTQLQSLVAAQ